MTTKNTRRAGQQLTALKVTLAAGSLLATLAGTRLLAVNDTSLAAAAAPEPVVITVPETAAPSAPAAASGGVRLELAPVPTAVAPVALPPVARTRSSR
ncbi:MAG: hypothetical protein KC425_24880 [Anaerolineales bacterium]|nr:hypothetical protein [Anaerolineales bacterium]